MELMLTGRTYGAEEGQTYGLSHMLVDDGEGLAKGMELAERVAQNAPLSNFAIMHALPRIAESDPASGLFAESLMASVASSSDEAKTRLKDFLEKRGKKVLRGLKEDGGASTTIESRCRRAAAPGASLGRPTCCSTASPTARIYLRSPHPLDAYPDKLTQRLEHWAKAAPDRVFLAQRAPDGSWRTLTYAQTLAQVRAIAQALLAAQALGRAADRHPVRQRHRARAARPRRDDDRRALRADLGALLADVERLRQAQIDHRNADAGPGVRRRAARRSRARSRPPCRATSRSSSPPIRGERPATLFAELLAAKPTDAVDAAHAKVGPDTIGKFLFTSGSTGNPKGVINTQRMLCSNQAMIRAALAVHRRRAAGAGRLAAVESHLRRQPRFRHGAAQRRLVLHRRGQAAARRHRSHRAQPSRDRADHLSQRAEGLRDAAAVSAQRRRAAAELLQPPEGAVLRRRGLGAARLGRIAGDGGRRPRGERIIFLSSLGSTETAPAALARTWESDQPGNIGLPMRGVELKLVPNDGKLEAPLQGPEHHAGLLAAARPHQGGLRRRRLLQDRRRAEVRRRQPIRARACCSTAASPRTSSSRAAPGSAPARCARSSSIIARRSCATR